MPRRNTRAIVWCQANMTDRHFSSSAMIKMMGSSLKELRERADSEKAIEFIIFVIVITKKKRLHPAAAGGAGKPFQLLRVQNGHLISLFPLSLIMH